MCPFTHNHSTRCLPAASSSLCQRSAFLTGSRPAVFHPLRFHPAIHDVIPLLTYVLSVYSRTSQGRVSASSAWMAAISSMRLFVVAGSPPFSSRWCPPYCSRHPHPPGPGLPRQAPSV